MYLVPMHIFIKMPCGKTIALDAKPANTVAAMKSKIEQKEGISLKMQHLIFAGNELYNGRTSLSSNKIKYEYTMELVPFRVANMFRKLGWW